MRRGGRGEARDGYVGAEGGLKGFLVGIEAVQIGHGQQGPVVSVVGLIGAVVFF